MNTTRKKQPEQVRARLLEAAEHIAVEKGLGALTLEAVASRAGVSKGGLLHHFSNRQTLVAAMLTGILERLDRDVAEAMAADTETRGKYTRAYIRTVTTPLDDHFESRLLGAVSLAMCGEVELAVQWDSWMHRRVEAMDVHERVPFARILRFAADGIWLGDISGEASANPAERAETTAKLIELTYTL